MPLRAVMAIFQKDPQVLITHPRRDLNSLADMHGKPILISAATMTSLLALAEGEIRLSGQPDPQIHLQPGAVPGRPQRHPGRLSHQRAFHDRAAGALRSPRSSCSPITAIPAMPTWCWCRRNGSTPIRKAVQAFVRRHARRLAGLSERQSRPGQCADQARQSRHDRRHHRPGDRQDETLRDADQRRRPRLRPGQHDRRAWKLFYDTMAAKGSIPRAWTTKAYDLRFARATLQNFNDRC